MQNSSHSYLGSVTSASPYQLMIQTCGNCDGVISFRLRQLDTSWYFIATSTSCSTSGML